MLWGVWGELSLEGLGACQYVPYSEDFAVATQPLASGPWIHCAGILLRGLGDGMDWCPRDRFHARTTAKRITIASCTLGPYPRPRGLLVSLMLSQTTLNGNTRLYV